MIDWKKLQNAMIALVFAIALGIGLVWYTMQMSQSSATEKQTQEGQLAQARQKFQSAGIEKSTISQYLISAPQLMLPQRLLRLHPHHYCC
jgi:uncharacterized protein HemX